MTCMYQLLQNISLIVRWGGIAFYNQVRSAAMADAMAVPLQRSGLAPYLAARQERLHDPLTSSLQLGVGLGQGQLSSSLWSRFIVFGVLIVF